MPVPCPAVARFVLVLMLCFSAVAGAWAQTGPEIQVRNQSATTEIVDGETVTFPATTVSPPDATSGPVSVKSFYIINVGDSPLSYSALTIDGPDAADFFVSGGSARTLDPGKNALVTIGFTPLGAGTRTATVHVSSNDADESPFDLTLTGVGLLPEITVTGPDGTEIPSGGTLTFPDTKVGSARTLDLTLANPSQAILFIEPETIEGENPAVFFTYPHPLPKRLHPGGQVEIPVTFYPTAVGFRTAVLKLESTDPDESPYEITLVATAVAPPQMVVEETAGQALTDQTIVDYGTCAAGAPGVTKTFTIKNPGGTGLAVFKISVPDDPLAQMFTVTSTASSATPLVVLPGQSANFTVQFTPKYAHAEKVWRMNIEHNITFRGSSDFWLSGTVVPSVISFAQPVFNAAHGDSEGLVTLTRTNAAGLATVKIQTGYLPSTELPPVSVASEGHDYTPLNLVTVNFAAGEAQKTVQVPLLAPADRAALNTHLKLTLSVAGPSGVNELGTQTTAVLRILAKDTTKPTLTLTSPAAGKVGDLVPLQARGTAGDAHGIDRVELRLNGAAPELASVVPAMSSNQVDPKKMEFSGNITPAEGANVLVVTAFDLKGNSTSVTRSFTFTRRQALEVMLVDAAQQPAASGALAVTITPAASGLISGGAASKAGTAAIGAPVKVTARPAANYLVQEWLGLPAGAQLSPARDVVSFTMPAEDLELKAVMTRSPFAPRPGLANRVHVLLDDDADDGPDASLKGCLTGTLTPTGGFSGKLLIQGQSVPVAAALLLNGPTVFTVAGKKLAAQPVPGGTLTLAGSGVQGHPFIAVIHRAAGSGLPPVEGLARWAGYSATAKVPGSLLNSATKGSHTVAFDVPVAPVPELPVPQGHGYATVSLTHLGAVTMAGVLADGTSVTMSTELLEKLNEQSPDEAPVYVPLPTPGATTKLGLLLGLLRFGVATPESDMSGDLRWFRPATASPKVLLYPQGWPQGLDLDATGCFFHFALTLQAALEAGATPSAQGVPGALTITGGKLPGLLSLTSFSIVKNAVVKSKPVDAGYTLTVTPTTGHFSGSFTPTWASPATVKPTFKGVILQKQAARGGYGFFLNNAKGETAPEAGKVLLGVPGEE